jgi:sulfatase maturation enzyme AslB (radical SAM superfamily)
MKIDHLTLVVTDDCNFSCDYCYKHRRRSAMTFATAAAAVRFFQPRLKNRFSISFTGGEPLLEFPLIRRLTRWIIGRPEISGLRPRFALTTNGSLLSSAILDFLEAHRFSVGLSFDGLAQEIHRKQGSLPMLRAALESLLARPRIRLGVNAVFSPKTVPLLANSIRFLEDSGVRDIRISTALNLRWPRASLDELGRQLRRIRLRTAAENRRGGRIQVANFREGAAGEKRLFACGAGRDRMAISPEGEIWGCHLFPDLFRIRGRPREIGAFRFGRLNDPASFARNCGPVLDRHSALGCDEYAVSGRWCLFCPEREACEVCPLHAAFAGGGLAAIPPHICAIQRLWISEKKALAGPPEVANRRENG